MSLHDRLIRETKKSAGKKEEKKRKSAGGDKDKERGGGNDSFKSREFIETSEESSSDSDRKSKSKSKKKKKKEVTGVEFLSGSSNKRMLFFRKDLKIVLSGRLGDCPDLVLMLFCYLGVG